jgi:hypothetical protein
MPRAVFSLLWERLSEQKEIFAYVLNMASNGDHYWVHAHVTPTFGADGQVVGYHSNRRVPGKSAIQTIAPIYRQFGRRVSAAWAANAAVPGMATLTPEEAHAVLLEGAATLELAEGLQLRRARLMGANRIELAGFGEAMRERLRAYGLFSEIISWKLRFFVPADANGVAVLGRVFETYPIERDCAREAA